MYSAKYKALCCAPPGRKTSAILSVWKLFQQFVMQLKRAEDREFQTTAPETAASLATDQSCSSKNRRLCVSKSQELSGGHGSKQHCIVLKFTHQTEHRTCNI